MIGTLRERPPSPWSGTSARRYSTPSGRAITKVKGTFGAAEPRASRSKAVTATVSPLR